MYKLHELIITSGEAEAFIVDEIVYFLKDDLVRRRPNPNAVLLVYWKSRYQDPPHLPALRCS